MLTGFFQAIIDFFGSVCSKAAGMLPPSPFQYFSSVTVGDDVLGAVSWLVPFPQIVSLLEAWAACIAVYYASKVLMRWTKILGG